MKLRTLPAAALSSLVLAFGSTGCSEDAAPISSMPHVPDVTLSSGTAGTSSRVGGETKVLVCHVPPGNPGNAHIIEISARALMAHLAHGDCLAAEGAEKGEPCDCAEETPPPPPVDF